MSNPTDAPTAPSLWEHIEETVATHRQAAYDKKRSALESEIAHVTQAIEELKVAQPTITRQDRVSDYGFVEEVTLAPVENPDLGQLQRTKRELSLTKRRYEREAEARHASRLAAHGLTPIAIVPAPFFDALCLKYRLYRFEHLNSIGYTHGESSIRAAHELWLASYLNILLVLTGSWFHWSPETLVYFVAHVSLVFLTLGAYAAFAKGLEEPRASVYLHPLGLLFTIGAASLVCSMVTGVATPDLTRPEIYPLLILSLVLMTMIANVGIFCISGLSAIGIQWGLMELSLCPQRWILLGYFPELVDQDNTGPRIQIEFRPTRPVSFKEKMAIMANAGLQPCLAAPAAAIRIKNQQELARQEIAKWLDPILFHRHYDKTDDVETVAILAHYGQFAAEAKVLKWVKKVGLTICSN